MGLTGTDLALLSARTKVARIAAFRLGFYPADVEGTGTVEPGDYSWRELKPEDDGQQWQVVAGWSMCADKCVASFTKSPASPSVKQTVTFTDTTTPTGEATYWHWDFGDGATSDLQNPTHVYTRAGTYTVTLHTSSPRGMCTTSTTVTITAPDVSWIAHREELGNVGEAFYHFTRVITGGIAPLTYAWNFGDSSVGVGPIITHMYTQTGPNPETFSVSVTVTDGVGATDTYTANLSVLYNV